MDICHRVYFSNGLACAEMLAFIKRWNGTEGHSFDWNFGSCPLQRVFIKMTDPRLEAARDTVQRILETEGAHSRVRVYEGEHLYCRLNS